MGKALSLFQTHKATGKLQLRTTFSNKKVLWEAMTSLVADGPDLTGWVVLDDVTEKKYAALYRTMCDRLRLVGRATLLRPDGQREFLVIVRKMNTLSDWDTDDAGKPRLNPVEDSADEESE